jgi:SNF2 family DNA or RNA helicase
VTVRVLAEIGRSRGRPVIRLRTSARLKALHKRLAGFAWSQESEAWQGVLSLDACVALRKEFGDRLDVGPKLWAWAEAELAREKRLRKLSRRHEGVCLPRVADLYPQLMERLARRPYQTTGARFIADARHVLLADQVGLGKTSQALGGIAESGIPGPYLVVAPIAALETVWRREIERWLPGHSPTIVSASRYSGTAARDAAIREALRFNAATSWVITNAQTIAAKDWWVCPKCDERWVARGVKSSVVDCEHPPDKVRTVAELFHPSVFEPEWGAILMDESQNILVRNAGGKTQVRNGALRLRSAEGGIRLALSGTPMRGTPLKLWGTLNWLRPQEYSSFWTWCGRFWEVEPAGYGGSMMIGVRKPGMEKRLGKSLDAVVLRRTKAEVAPELPAKQYMGDELYPGGPSGIWLEMEPSQARAYREMARGAVAELDSGTLTAIGGLAQLTRLKQFANGYGSTTDGIDFNPGLPSNKFDWTLQWLTDAGLVGKDAEPQGKVIIASQFSSWLWITQMVLATKYGVPSRRIDGSVSEKTRISAQDLFNDPEGEIRVMFLQTQSGGASITLDAADDMIIWDETWVPDEQEQLEGRNDNRRPEERVAPRRYWYLRSKGSVDQHIADRNATLDRDQKQVLDGRRGVAYVKSIVAAVKEGL